MGFYVGLCGHFESFRHFESFVGCYRIIFGRVPRSSRLISIVAFFEKPVKFLIRLFCHLLLISGSVTFIFLSLNRPPLTKFGPLWGRPPSRLENLYFLFIIKWIITESSLYTCSSINDSYSMASTKKDITEYRRCSLLSLVHCFLFI